MTGAQLLSFHRSARQSYSSRGMPVSRLSTSYGAGGRFMSARMKGFDTNVAYRDDIDVLRQELQGLGATHVLTYDELDDKKATKAKVKEWTNGQVYIPIQITGTSAC